MLASLLAWVLYYEIFAREDLNEIWSLFLISFESRHWGWLLAVILLMPVNWILETQKWRVLIQNFEPLPFSKAVFAILSGVTFSIFTPNRIGEYGGRILYVKPENNWKAVLATLVGSYSQLLAILSFGVLGFGIFMSFYFELEPIVLKAVLFLCIALILVLLFCFYNIDLVIPLAKKIPFANRFKRVAKNIRILRNYDRQTLNKALMYAVLRYLIYSFQYYLLLVFFGINVGLLEGMTGIATIYLFQTSIPLPPLMGLVARGKLALMIWENFSQNEINILAATFILWIINLIFPALVGTIFIGKANILGAFGFGKKS